MDLNTLNLVIALCTGSKDPQACHKKYDACLATKKSAQSDRVSKCETEFEFAKCMKANGGDKKDDQELISDCIAK